MTVQEREKVTGTLAFAGAENRIKGFLDRIRAALKAKNLTLAKLIDIYFIIDKAVKEIEAVVKEK